MRVPARLPPRCADVATPRVSRHARRPAGERAVVGCCGGERGRVLLLVAVGRRVAGQQAIEAAAGLFEDGLGLPELVLRARLGDLHGGDRQRLGGVTELVELTRGPLADGLPRGAEALAVGLDVGGALVGQRERLAAVLLNGADEALVL